MATLSRRQRSTSAPLALAWGALIAYASLFPFSGWRWPPGAGLGDLLLLRWVGYLDRFDVLANLLGYVPIGGLIWVAMRRRGATPASAWVGSVGIAALLSYAMEVTQHLLPPRVPSLLDSMLNLGGALLGALGATVLDRFRVLEALSTARDRWLARRGVAALLLLLWPVALLFPTPVPLGLGQIGQRLRDALAAAFGDFGALDGAAVWLAQIDTSSAPLSATSEWLAVTLGLLGPCLLAYAASHATWRRLVLAGGALAMAIGVTTLSTALNFGPEHAFAWRTAASMPGLLTGVALAVLLAPVPARLAAGLGLIVITTLLVLVAQAPADPYYAQSLQGWEQGRFIRFYGAAQWVGWLWPYLAIGWLLVRVSSRE